MAPSSQGIEPAHYPGRFKLIHHADQGSQYTAVEFTNRLKDWNLAASYSSTGDCFDNAAMEAVWATLKREIRHLHGD